MFENPRRGRQARNVTTNAPKILDLKSPSEQIFSRKLPFGAPDRIPSAKMMKNRIPQSKMIPQYCTLKSKLPKYCTKKSPISFKERRIGQKGRENGERGIFKMENL